MSAIALSEVGITGLDPVMEVMKTAFDPDYGEAWTESQTMSMLAMPGAWLSLARIEGHAAGFALNRLIADEAELLLLAVSPAFRRRGIATALIDRSRTILLERGGRLLHLEVRHNNPATELYRKAGFAQIGRRPGYYRSMNGVVHDALTLSCTVERI